MLYDSMVAVHEVCVEGANRSLLLYPSGCGMYCTMAMAMVQYRIIKGQMDIWTSWSHTARTDERTSDGHASPTQDGRSTASSRGLSTQINFLFRCWYPGSYTSQTSTPSLGFKMLVLTCVPGSRPHCCDTVYCQIHKSTKIVYCTVYSTLPHSQRVLDPVVGAVTHSTETTIHSLI